MEFLVWKFIIRQPWLRHATPKFNCYLVVNCILNLSFYRFCYLFWVDLQWIFVVSLCELCVSKDWNADLIFLKYELKFYSGWPEFKTKINVLVYPDEQQSHLNKNSYLGHDAWRIHTYIHIKYHKTNRLISSGILHI
jgi:hypothetical protein